MLRSRIFLPILSLLLVAPFAGASDGMSLSDLKTIHYQDAKEAFSFDSEGDVEVDSKKRLKYNAMRDAALALGAQHGYIRRMETIKAALRESENLLDDIYDFSVLMKMVNEDANEMYLLPPVLQEGKNVTKVSNDGRRIVVSGKYYRIARGERLVSVAPNWRQYLIFDVPVKTSTPPEVLMPEPGSEEEVLWAKWVEKGWNAGISQAENEMKFRIRRLGDDFVGMVKYMVLVEEGKMSEPVIASSQRNVVGGGEEMYEDQRVIQLSVPSGLNPNVRDWEPHILDNRGSLRVESENNNYKGLLDE